MTAFKALVVDKTGEEVKVETRHMELEQLPEQDLLVKVVYSSVNYKDALACIANGNIVKKYPFIPGIDLAGVVVSSGNAMFQEGDEILVTGYELGVSHFGGFSEYARISSQWAVHLPEGLSMREAMILGTAGFTAALSVDALQASGVTPDGGPVLVTGSTGGVGSISVSILSELGYEVVASTGKSELTDYLHRLGAKRVIARNEINPAETRSLNKQLWAGAVDCVGGSTLSYILSSIKYGGAVAASGLTGGTEISTTVFPFILRSIQLIGIDSVNTSMDRRRRIWRRLAAELKPRALEAMHKEISLEQVKDAVPSLLNGESKGRILVKL